MFPLFTRCTCPFLIMFITSYPCNVLHAVAKEKKPIPALTSRLMRAMILFDEIVQVFYLPKFNQLGKDPTCFELGNGFGIGSVLIYVDHAGN